MSIITAALYSNTRIKTSPSANSTTVTILTGYPTSSTPSHGVCPLWAPRVGPLSTVHLQGNSSQWLAPVTDMLLAVLSVCSQEELSEVDSESGDEALGLETGMTPEDLQRRRQEIRNKIMAIGKMQKVFQMLRDESENATELQFDGDQARSEGLSVQGTEMGRAIRTFNDARRIDIQNERLPEPTAPSPTITMFPASSMRRASVDAEGMTMEYMIKKTLEADDCDEGGVVERIADRIARGRVIAKPPSGLKRHGTA
ncbi:hypothetical protein C0992_004467 [Termitomyces sp. T32_za158]|nr:hypothetical protein C0992_004467 [Termitomyces sp. T32_za158]